MKDKIKTLPVWAQKYFEKIESERDTAIRALNRSTDSVTPSHFYYESILCTGESKTGGPSQKRFYVQSYEMIIEAFDVEVRVRPDEKHKRIQVSWSDPDKMSTDIAMIPTLQQTIELVSKDNMRDYRQ